jgi:acyl-CoA synthetase (NDP forming)
MSDAIGYRKKAHGDALSRRETSREKIMSVLQSLFAPKSVAIIGASEKNPWARFVLDTLKTLEFSGPLHLVNQRGGTVLGQETVTSAAAISEPIDAAFVMVPASAMEQALHDMAKARIRSAVVVTSGFAEVGHDGATDQQRLIDLARSLGITVMGPNSLGFINLVDRVALAAMPVRLPMLPDPSVGIVSQSGATAGVLSNTAHATNVSLSHIIALGNEGMVDIADAIEFLIDCPTTRAIGVFAEAVRRPAAFIAAASRALAARKPIVLLKVGVGELAAQVAQAHTGALVGDNRIFDAVCRDLGIVRVDTMEQLLQTANLLAHTGALDDGGFAVASLSGGACEMIADLGEAQGVPFATFSPATKERLASILPAYATMQNPLDVTGGVLSNMQAFEDALAAAGQDQGVALIAACSDLAQSADTDTLGRQPLVHLANGIKRSGVPGFLLPQSYLTVSPYARESLETVGMPLSSAGLGMAMAAVGGAFRWSAAAKVLRGEGLDPGSIAPADVRPGNEREALDFLASRGVPTIAARTATSADEAADIARTMSHPVVLKILSPDIAHKTEVGGVALNIVGPEAAGSEYEAMMARVNGARPDARIEGITVSPMLGGGIELIVGVARDPTWGLVLAVGLGGVWVEVLADADLSLLPVTPRQVEAMLGRLKAAKILDGYRGQPAADRHKVAEVIAAIGNAAIALGPDLVSLEINPLWISGDDVQCLDALILWQD